MSLEVLYPWNVIITNVPGSSPKIIIQNVLSRKYLRNEEIRRKIQYFITQSGRVYVDVNFGILLSTPTDDYYLGIIVNRPKLLPIDIPADIPIIPGYPGNWLQTNVHVVLVYVGTEIECVIDGGNIGNCIDQYAIQSVERFSLRIRKPPVNTPPTDCGVYVNGKSMCFDT